jgi:large subunit ribosomal protein L24
MNIKKGDTILVTKGKDRGKTGKVISVDPTADKIVAEGRNVYKCHVKPSNKYPQGGIIEKNMPIKRENVAVVCPGCNKATKVSSTGTGKDKRRICSKCKETLDAVK